MWREEAGVLEMLFAYINEFEQFSGWTSWRGVIMDILSCHEDARRQRLVSVCATIGMEGLGGHLKTEVLTNNILKPESSIPTPKVKTSRTSEYYKDENDEGTNLPSWSGNGDLNEEIETEDVVGKRTDEVEDDDMKEMSTINVDSSMAQIQIPIGSVEENEQPIFVKPDLPTEVIDVDEEKESSEDAKDFADIKKINAVMLQSVNLPFVGDDVLEGGQLSESSSSRLFASTLQNIDIIPAFPIAALPSVSNPAKLHDAPRKLEPKYRSLDPVGGFKMGLRCRFCSKMFTSHAAKLGHEKRHTEDKPFSCSICAKSFTQISNKIIHERSHTGEKPFRCSFCSKAFTNRSNKVRHERIHTGERPFNCRFCGKAFNQDSSKAAHERIHTGEKPYSCSFCGKTFTDNSGKAKHERRHMMETLNLP